MKKVVKENLILAAAVGTFIGLFAYLTTKLVKTKPALILKDHAYLKIDKDLIKKYMAKNGDKIKFKFTEDNGIVKLQFIGSKNLTDRVIDEQMNISIADTVKLENKKFGKFTKDENGKTLHELLTENPESDWFLKPVKCDIDNRYVSYELSNEALSIYPAATTINPSPPY